MKTVGIRGLNIKFKPSDAELNNIKDNFAFYLNDLVNTFKDKDGIFIVIDDINGLSDTPEFANCYKSFVDTMATSIDFMPIGIMLIGYPEKFIKLYKQNPSLNRIFHTHELEGLSNTEIINFYKDIFTLNKIDFDDSALVTMVNFTSSMPIMMQEIGDATFWRNSDNYIEIMMHWKVLSKQVTE